MVSAIASCNFISSSDVTGVVSVQSASILSSPLEFPVSVRGRSGRCDDGAQELNFAPSRVAEVVRLLLPLSVSGYLSYRSSPSAVAKRTPPKCETCISPSPLLTGDVLFDAVSLLFVFVPINVTTVSKRTSEEHSKSALIL